MMELPKHQKAWVAEHLGHSLDVHGKYYRMPLDSVETAKITKLMYLMDHCKMNEVRGLNLNEVDTVITRDRILQCTDERDYEDQLQLTSLTKVTWIVVQSTSTMKPKVTLPANTPKLKGENLWPGENRKMGNVRIGHLTKNAKLSNYFKILSPINNARTRLSVKSISIYFLTVKENTND